MVAKTIAAGIVALTTLGAAPASASGLDVQIRYGGPGHMGPGHAGPARQHDWVSQNEVRRMLRHRGYHAIDFIGRAGPVYRVTARKHGERFIFLISARDGDILMRRAT